MRVDSRKFLSVGVAVLVSTLAVNGASSRETAAVKDVAFNAIGDSLEVTITATEDSKFTYFELKAPHRLVVDFHGIQNGIGFKEKQVDNAVVARVRTSFFSDKRRKATRIVFDLADNAPYRVLEDGGGIVRVVFGATVRAPQNQMAGPALVPEPSPASYSLPGLSLPAVRLSTVLLAPEATLPMPQAPAETAAAPAPPPVTTPAVAPLVAATESALRAQPAQPPQAPPQQQQTQITIVPPTPPQIPSTTPTPIPQFTGELISIDVINAPIQEFLRLIKEISGLNFVLDPAVGGTVTLNLSAVPWDQALDVVLKNNQLGGQLQGNILRIANNATLQAEQQAQNALRAAQEQAVQLVQHTYTLSYTKAPDVQATLRNPGILSPRGTIIPDARTNSLIVTDIPSQFETIESMVKFLDTPMQQVEIEARLLQANKSFSREIGNQLGFLYGDRGGNVITGIPGASSPFSRSPAPRATGGGAGTPLVANFPGGGTSGLSFLLQSGGDLILDEIIGAAEARGSAKLISRPRVTVQNNQQATIQQGTQIPLQTNVNNTITVQFQPFTLNLSVTPQITNAGTILLNVNINNSQPDFARAVGGIPSVSTQQATTQVLIPDGGTAVIGGILIDTDSLNVRQVPGLGSLPVIGNLFKSTNTVKSTAELIFFITPRIKPLDTITVQP
ncbi:MAG: type IV pilus secretin PilQ [Acidobacteria bacterium]|nr:type IV pilus secretin PilQ [Acidobacteriota bacterium]